MNLRGWLLDPYVKGKNVHLWFKTVEGGTIRAMERYRPHFLVEPDHEESINELQATIESIPIVYSAAPISRFIDLRRMERRRLLEVHVDSVDVLEDVIECTRKMRNVKLIYDTGLAPIQWYLIEKDAASTRLCDVEVEGENLKRLSIVDDNDMIEPPPFKILRFNAPVDGVIDLLEIFDGEDRLTHSFNGTEKDVLESFQLTLDEVDPDVIITDGISLAVKRILKRANGCGLKFRFGRGGEQMHGRILVGLSSFLDMGLAGLVERARFTLAPVGLTSDWEPGKTIDSRQCYEAHRLGVAVPEMRGGVAFESDAWSLVRHDKGGMLFSPQAGLHENVACLDFESMFPNIIVRRNVSYETVTEDGVDTSIPGFMGAFTGQFLERRLKFKHLMTTLPPGSKEWRWCEERQSSLKLMLVVVYGYSGCYANRFANVRVFQEINRQARETLVQALNVSLGRGFEVVYGDTDSIFVKKLNATRKDYDELAKAIEEETNLHIKVDKHFKFLVLLRKLTDPQQVASRRYFGKLTDGSLFCRGIEIRRHDTPPYIKSLQERAMRVLFDAEDADDVVRRGLPRAVATVNRACDEIRRKRVEARELVVSKRIRREISDYRSLQPHVVAAMLGGVEEGDCNFVFINAERSNPYMRVMPAYMLDEASRGYDWRKYVSLARKAASNILAPFTDEFDGSQLGLRLTQLPMFTDA